MRCSLKQLNDALDFFKYNLGIDKNDAMVEIVTREEDFDKGKLMSCLTMIVTYEKESGKYDRWQGIKKIKHSLEIFPESENRHPQLTTEESQELIPKND
jgi:hypothetical protein